MSKNKLSKSIKLSTPPIEVQSTAQFGKQFSVTQLNFVFAIISISLGFYVYKMFIWGPYVYLFQDIGIDSFYTIYPNLLHLWDYFHQVGIPQWSFSQGVGQNIYPFWFDQFYFWILALDRESIAGSLAYFQVIEIALAGFLFRAYLKLVGINPIIAIIGGLSYGFCGFMVVAGEWDNRFGVEVFNTAFLIWSLEKYFRQKKWFWLPLPIALIAINQPFNLFIYGIIIFIYVSVRHFELSTSFKQFIFLLGKIAVICFIGIGLSCVMSIGNIDQLLNSPRGSGEFSMAENLLTNPIFKLIDSKELGTFILRLFSSDLLGTGNEFKGWANYFEAPLLYVGILSLLVGPQSFVHTSRQQRIVYFTLIFVILISILFPYFRWAFWAFSGNYYRTYSFFIGLAVLLLGMRGLNQVIEHNRLNKLVLGVSLVGLFILLLFPYGFEAGSIEKEIRTFIFFLLICYFFLIYFISFFKQIVLPVILILVIFEIGYLSPKKFKNRQILTNQGIKEIYLNSPSAKAAEFAKQHDKSFFRLNEDKSVGPSDPKVKKYFGTSSYHSFNQLNYVRFLAAIGAIKSNDEYATRGIDQDITNIFSQAMLSSKYLIINQNENEEMFLNTGFDSLARFDNTLLTQFRYALPFGYTYDSYMLKEDFMKIPMWVKRKVLLDVVVIDPDKQKNFSHLTQQSLNQIDTAYSTQYTLAALEKSVNERQKQHLSIQKFGQNFFTGSISLPSPQFLFFSIPFDLGWELLVDNQVHQIHKVQIGFSGALLSAGKHQIELTYTPPYQKEGSMISLFFLIIYGVLIFFSRKKNTFLRQ